jgi:oleate hydratase
VCQTTLSQAALRLALQDREDLTMNDPKAYLVGGGIGSLAAAAFLIRDGNMPGNQITILEAARVSGGSLDGGGGPATGYSLRGGRMFTTDNYECTWDLFQSIPSLQDPSKTVFQETLDFNELHHSQAKARLVNAHRARVPVTSMGFSMEDRLELLKLGQADEAALGSTRITDWLSPAFFDTRFWLMWSTTFAFQPWHSAVEFKRYLHRFLLEFSRIDDLSGVKRTVFNQYDSLVRPLQAWLEAKGVHFHTDCTVTDLAHETRGGLFGVTGICCVLDGARHRFEVADDDLFFLQNGSMTDASSLGTMSAPPAKLDKGSSVGWHLWELLAEGRPQFGQPAVFNRCIAQSCWESFTITLPHSSFFDQMSAFTGNEPGTGGLVTFKDSNWLMSVVLPHQPHFLGQPEGVQVCWGYALFPDRIGNFVPRAMEDCSGLEILRELCGHLRFDLEPTMRGAICLPCRMPYITSMFMPRELRDRPLPVPVGTKNLALVSQFVEIAEDVVFTVEYSVRAAQMAVYELLNLTGKVPPVTPQDRSVSTRFQALVKAFR